MENVFQMIGHVTSTEDWNWVFFEPNSEPVQIGLQVNEVNLGKNTRYDQTYDQSQNGHSHQVQFSDSFRDNNRQQRGPLKKGQGQLHYKNSPKKITCYYCQGEHKINDCIKLTKEKAKDIQRDTDGAKHYKTIFEIPCERVALPSMRHHLLEPQKANGAIYGKPAAK